MDLELTGNESCDEFFPQFFFLFQNERWSYFRAYSVYVKDPFKCVDSLERSFSVVM